MSGKIKKSDLIFMQKSLDYLKGIREGTILNPFQKTKDNIIKAINGQKNNITLEEAKQQIKRKKT